MNHLTKSSEKMRFAFVVSSGLGYQIPDLFQNDASFKEFENALQIIKQNRFQGVELNLHFDDQRRLSRIKRSVDDSGLKLAAVGTGLIYARDHISFTDPNSHKRAQALSIIKNLLRFAASESAILIIGLVRGTLIQRAVGAEDRLRESLIECDSEAEKCGTKIALEAINRYETNLLNTADDVVNVIEKENLSSTGLLLDTFHMNIEERSIADAIRDHASRIAHFHIADSNRYSPGFGHLQIEAFLQLLRELRYKGWVSAELLPKPSNMRAVADTAKFLKVHGLMDT